MKPSGITPVRGMELTRGWRSGRMKVGNRRAKEGGNNIPE